MNSNEITISPWNPCDNESNKTSIKGNPPDIITCYELWNRFTNENFQSDSHESNWRTIMPLLSCICTWSSCIESWKEPRKWNWFFIVLQNLKFIQYKSEICDVITWQSLRHGICRGTKYQVFTIFVHLPRKFYLLIVFCTWKSETIRLYWSGTLQMTPTRWFQLKTNHNKSQI